MRDNDNSPWELLSRTPDVELRVGVLETGCLGFFDPETRTIWLDRRQSRRQMRSTLMHELMHVERGDEDSPYLSPVLATRQEIAASVRAARNLIPIWQLARLVMWAEDEREMAEELNVDEETLRIRLLTLSDEEHRVLDAATLLAEHRGIA